MVLRVVVALGLLGSAAVHLDLWLVGVRDIPTVGPLFGVNVLAGAVLAIAVLVSRHWLPMLGAAGFGAVTLGAFLLSRTVGLFGMQGTPWGTAGVLAAIAELVCVVGGVLALWHIRRTRRTRGQRRQPV